MNERFDLHTMLLAIKDDEAINISKTTRLSQDQIQELVKRREMPDIKKAANTTEVR